MKPMPPTEVPEIVPQHIAYDYQVLSVEGRLPTHDQKGQLHLLCLRTLTDKEKEDLVQLLRSFRLAFVEPDHPDYPEYAEIASNFWQIVEQYPPEENSVLGADA